MFEGIAVERLPVVDHRPDLDRDQVSPARSVKWVPLSVRTVWSRQATASIRPAQEVGGGPARHLLVQFDEGELRRPIDRDDGMEPALSGSHLGDVDMEIADRISIQLALGRAFVSTWATRSFHEAASNVGSGT
jgi:hypothetical protein